jgi:hypothetical protein
MFEDLYDALSFLGSWRWPTAKGQVTEVDVERLSHQRGPDTLRLSIAYKFSLGNDGPYTGESFWEPAISSIQESTGCSAQNSQGAIGKCALSPR